MKDVREAVELAINSAKNASETEAVKKIEAILVELDQLVSFSRTRLLEAVLAVDDHGHPKLFDGRILQGRIYFNWLTERLNRCKNSSRKTLEYTNRLIRAMLVKYPHSTATIEEINWGLKVRWLSKNRLIWVIYDTNERWPLIKVMVYSTLTEPKTYFWAGSVIKNSKII